MTRSVTKLMAIHRWDEGVDPRQRYACKWSHRSVSDKANDDDYERQPAVPRRRRRCCHRIFELVFFRPFRQTSLPKRA